MGGFQIRIIVFGASGFIGRNICRELEKDHDVTKSSSENITGENIELVNLLDENSIYELMNRIQPEIVVNCAGVLSANMAEDLNSKFTHNILNQTSKISSIKKVIISGSAAEYGIVNKANIPVNENTPLNADSGYGLSKLNEESVAHNYRSKNSIKIIVLRIFNPIGKGMAEKFLVMGLLRQIKEVKSGHRNAIEISRLDSKRDYISIKDVATAFRAVIDGDPKKNVYNVGSGVSKSNGELLKLILKNSKLDNIPQIIETSTKAEPLVAIQADINRISNEFGWHPLHTIDKTVKEITSS